MVHFDIQSFTLGKSGHATTKINQVFIRCYLRCDDNTSTCFCHNVRCKCSKIVITANVECMILARRQVVQLVGFDISANANCNNLYALCLQMEV